MITTIVLIKAARQRIPECAMKLAGIDKLPIESQVLQAFVSEGIKPAIDNVVTFGGS